MYKSFLVKRKENLCIFCIYTYLCNIIAKGLDIKKIDFFEALKKIPKNIVTSRP